MPAAESPTRVALFAKAPVAGRVKTRLGRDIGDERAAELYGAFLGDLVERFASAPDLEVRLWAASETDVSALAAYGIPSETQPSGHLGVRMHAAMASSLAQRDKVIVIGSDAPTLPTARVRAAASAMDVADLVVGPAVDGGYALIGGTAAFDFGSEIRWSTEHALADTLARATTRKRRVARVRPLYDIDTVADLRLLRIELSMHRSRAPRTAAVLARLHPF